jgi:RNA polymerase sigma-70 factor (ECF subfamily)
MTPLAASPVGASPVDLIAGAASDPAVRADLRLHARARLGRYLPGRPATVREQLIEDAVQEALRRAINRRADYDPARSTPTGWLNGFLDKVLSEECRKVRRAPAQPPDPDDWDPLDRRVGDPAELRELLERISPEAREIVIQHHLEGRGHAEIAGRLGISEGASRVRLARAMNELKRAAAKEAGR